MSSDASSSVCRSFRSEARGCEESRNRSYVSLHPQKQTIKIHVPPPPRQPSSLVLWCAFPQRGLPDTPPSDPDSSHFLLSIAGCGTLQELKRENNRALFLRAALMVSVTAVLLVALTVDGLPAQSYIESSSSSSSSLGRRDTSSLLYVWLCPLSRNLLRALTGQKGMNAAPLAEPLSSSESVDGAAAVCPSLLPQTPGLMSAGGGGRDGRSVSSLSLQSLFNTSNE